MKISKQENLIEEKSTHFNVRRLGINSKMIFLVIGLILLSFTIGFIVLGTKETGNRVKKWAEEHGHNALRKDVRLRYALVKLPERVIDSYYFSNENLPKISIDIKFKHIQKIKKKRAKALADGILVQEPDDFVPATIRYDNRTIKVKLRLKGDWTDHLEDKKWSFRIHVKDKDSIFGMRRFSIQNPKVRAYYGEPLFMETLRHVGVLVPRYFFINVVINGEDMGIMALEEHFSKELLESNSRREGVIVRYDESLLWDSRVLARQQNIGDKEERIFHSYKNSEIDAFASSNIAKSPALRENLAVAVGLLRSFTMGDLSPSEVFDAKLMGRFLAVIEFWGARHAMYWHNLRFYLNPISLKLEPIGFDADVNNRYEPGKILCQIEPITKEILDDSKIFDEYHKTLIKLSKQILDGSLIDELEKVQDQSIKALRKEFYLLETFPFDELKERANYFLSLSPDTLKKSPIEIPSYPKLIHTFLIEDKKGSYLEMSNAVPHDISISSIKWIGIKDSNSTRDFKPTSGISFPLTLFATPPGELPITHTISCKSVEDPQEFSLEIIASIKGNNNQYAHKAKYYFAPLKLHPIPSSTSTELLSMHPFLTIDKLHRKIVIKQGQWEVQNSIVIPDNYDLFISKGTTLSFPNGKGLFASGALLFEGTKENPILLKGQPSGDGNSTKTWQGIFVKNSKNPSKWSYVTVRDTKNIEQPGWTLTGGVNFYKSEVHLKNCVFKDNHGEDALNIVNSKFRIINTNFISIISDAFDSDFSTGEVEGGSFRDIGKAGGGDAIDISGSKVSVSGTHFENVTDKALSVGERSTMYARNIQINNAGTAAASKDGSLLEIRNSHINQVVNAALMAYIKKSEFGPARIISDKITYSGSAAFAYAETGSEIIVDGKEIHQEPVNVKELYNTIMKPGLRK